MFLSTYWTRVQSFLPWQLENAKNQRNDSNACTLPKLTNRRLVSLSFYIEPECVVTRTTRLTSQRGQEGNLAKSLFVIFTKFSFGWKKTGVAGGGAFYSVNTFLFVTQNDEFVDDEKYSSGFAFFLGANLRVNLQPHWRWRMNGWLSLFKVYYEFIISLL